MMQDLKKEFRFGLRNNKFLILFVSLLFFAILTPVMTKVVLPQVLRSQLPGLSEEALRGMLDMSQLGVMRSYMGDVFEIGSIIVTFTLCGLMAQEITDNTLVLPLCSGKRYGGIVGAKMLVFGIALLLVPTVALLVDYAYAGMLFSFDIGVGPVIRGGLLQGFYMVFLLANVILWGTITKKTITTGFVTLVISFGLYFIGGLFDIHSFLPSGLLVDAITLSSVPSSSLLQTLLITGVIITAFLTITVVRLNHMEWNER